MHALKRRAHGTAWYRDPEDDDDTLLIPNFWGRSRPTRLRDTEHGTLHHANTEDETTSPAADKRRVSFQNEEGAFGGPHKSGTFPQGPAGNLPNRSPDNIGPDEVPTSSESTDDSSRKIDEKDAEHDVEPSDEQSTNVRRRKRDKVMPWRADGKEERAQKKAEKKKAEPDTSHLTPVQQAKNVFFSWINIMLIFVPTGIALGNIKAITNQQTGQPVVVFVINFLAIIPLAGILSFATEELAKFIGEVLGGLLNASFGNAVELIVSIIALVQGKVLIVQTSLIGSMLSNLLLVMGMCFAFGGIGRQEQFFNVTVAQTAASLLALAIGGLIIPTAFKIFAKVDRGVAPTSRGTAVMLLITYGCYLFFQLKTHREVYNEPSQKVPKKKSKKRKGRDDIRKSIANAGGAAAQVGVGEQGVQAEEGEHEEDPPLLTKWGALITLAGSTVLVALCAEYMVSAIDALAKDISEEFIGLILLPIVGNAAEHATAVTVAIKDKMDLAIGVAIGSSLQIALLVLPLMVMFSWWGVGDNTLTLAFDGFQVVVLFIAIVVVNYLIQDGKSHWLEGVLLEVTYFVIAIAAWFYPANGDVAG